MKEAAAWGGGRRLLCVCSSERLRNDDTWMWMLPCAGTEPFPPPVCILSTDETTNKGNLNPSCVRCKSMLATLPCMVPASPMPAEAVPLWFPARLSAAYDASSTKNVVRIIDFGGSNWSPCLIFTSPQPALLYKTRHLAAYIQKRSDSNLPFGIFRYVSARFACPLICVQACLSKPILLTMIQTMTYIEEKRVTGSVAAKS